MKKRVYVFVTVLLLTLCLFGCGKNDAVSADSTKSTEVETTTTKESKDKTEEETTQAETESTMVMEVKKEVPLKGTVKVGVIGVIPNEVLTFAKPILREEGWQLEIINYSDYSQPNEAVLNGECDANYYEHQLFLSTYNDKNKTDLIEASKIHYEPLGLYKGSASSLSDLKKGDKIALPDDTIMQTRALFFLQDLGLITVKESVGMNATVNDIETNEKELEFVPTPMGQIKDTLQTVSFGIMDGNHAIVEGLSPIVDTVLNEAVTSIGAQKFAGLLVVKEGNENTEGIRKLIRVLHSKEVKNYIRGHYLGSVAPWK